MYLDCFYQSVVVPILPLSEERPDEDYDDTKACFPAAAAGSLTRHAIETGRLEVHSHPLVRDSKVDPDDCSEIPAAAAPSISRNSSTPNESFLSDRTLVGQGETENKCRSLISIRSTDDRVLEPINIVSRSIPTDPNPLTQLLEDTSSQTERDRDDKVPELWVAGKEIPLGDGVYKWVCWKYGTGAVRTRMGTEGNEIIKRYRAQRWPRRVQRWMAFSFNKRAGHKPWERTRFTNVLSGIESLDCDIYEKSQSLISEVEISEIPAKTKVFWGARTNHDCTLLRVESIEALKMYCKHDYDGFMNMVHQYKTVITKDICENIPPGPMFMAGMVKDATQRLAATSRAGLVPDETDNYVRTILHHHLANRK
jgi:hypothetical protein